MHLIIYSQRCSTIGLVPKEVRISSIQLSDCLPTWILMTIYCCLFSCVTFSLRFKNSNLKPVNSLMSPGVSLTIYCLPPNTANNWSSPIQSLLTEEVKMEIKPRQDTSIAKKERGRWTGIIGNFPLVLVPGVLGTNPVTSYFIIFPSPNLDQGRGDKFLPGRRQEHIGLSATPTIPWRPGLSSPKWQWCSTEKPWGTGKAYHCANKCDLNNDDKKGGDWFPPS